MKAENRTVPVLMYHHISPVDGMITTSPVNFELQLAWLARHGYRSLSSTEFAAHLAGQPAPPRSVLITFDDGYLDNWVYAYPLLQKYGFSAMIFLVTSWIGDGPARNHLGHGELPETPSHHDCKQRIQAGDADSVMLRWEEVLAMRDSGTIEFHSHTHTHTRWDTSPRAGEKNALMAQELADSRAALTARLGGVSEHLCWPQGYFDADYVAIARQAGFRYLYTTQAFGQNRPGGEPSLIFRFAVRNTAGAALGRRVRLAAHPVLGPLFNRWKLWKRARRRKA
jgi:peptidoglycan/xylan/chitin deacetylase (PgdA/CDA1 family)